MFHRLTDEDIILGRRDFLRRCGKCGLEVSELFRHTAKHADDLCVIRSMAADVPNHEPSLMFMNCGEGRLRTRAS